MQVIPLSDKALDLSGALHRAKLTSSVESPSNTAVYAKPHVCGADLGQAF